MPAIASIVLDTAASGGQKLDFTFKTRDGKVPKEVNVNYFDVFSGSLPVVRFVMGNDEICFLQDTRKAYRVMFNDDDPYAVEYGTVTGAMLNQMIRYIQDTQLQYKQSDPSNSETGSYTLNISHLPPFRVVFGAAVRGGQRRKARKTRKASKKHHA